MKADRGLWGSESPSDLVAVDFENYFDKEMSLRKLSVWEYVFHPKTFPYLMSVKTEGFEWCGDPVEFARWDVFNGRVACAHNASFDGLVWKRLERDGVIRGIVPRRWLCTADLAAYLRVKRSLQSAVKLLYDIDISKQERADAEGKTAADMKAGGTWDAMVKYGMDDAVWCHKIACDFVARWPATAQFISERNREAAWRGFAVDRGLAERDLESLKEKVFEYGRRIPWFPDEAALSPIALRRQARKDGITVPASLAKSDEEARAFFEKHEATVPWVGAVRNYRQATMLLRKVETLVNGTREDGTFPYSSVYFGANTGRLTAGAGGNTEDAAGKFNLMNLPREALQGVDLRKMIVPRKGKLFFVGDYAQIEARLLLWRAGEHNVLSKIRDEGYNIYEAEAENMLDIKDARGLKKRDPATYQMVKGMVLGSGYQMSGKRFRVQAPVLTGGAFNPTEAEAIKSVRLYRDSHRGVVNYWNRHQTFLLSSAYNNDKEHKVQLASGRWLTYFNPAFALVKDEKTGEERREIVVQQVLGEPHRRMYGGKLTENEMQATGVDILWDAWAAVEDAGYPVVWTLYDELVSEVDVETAQEDGERIAKLMTSSSPWASGLPLEVEWKLADRYFK